MISKSTMLLWALLNIYILSFIYLAYFFQSLCLYYYYALTVIKCTNKFNTAPFINHSTSQLHLIPFSIISVYSQLSLYIFYFTYIFSLKMTPTSSSCQKAHTQKIMSFRFLFGPKGKRSWHTKIWNVEYGDLVLLFDPLMVLSSIFIFVVT